MAKQKKHIEKEQKPAGKCCWNVWKITAIAVIAIFLIILACGLVKLYHFKSSFSPITPEQQAMVNRAVNQDLMGKGDAIDNYNENLPDKIRKMHDDQNTRAIIPVFLQNSTTRHLYIVDANSGEIISHTVTTDYINTCTDKPQRKEGGREYEREGFNRMGMNCGHFR
jgi:uncharacterized protein YpmB